MAKLGNFETDRSTAPEPTPGSAKYIALGLIDIGKDLQLRSETEPRAALNDSAKSLRTLGFDEFALAADRLGLLDGDDIVTGAHELQVAVTHFMMQFTLAISSAQKSGGSAQVDPSVDAHKPLGARFL